MGKGLISVRTIIIIIVLVAFVLAGLGEFFIYEQTNSDESASVQSDEGM
jgi:hypothetical protein